MKRLRFFTAALCVALALLITGAAAAGGASARIVQAFPEGDTLYAYVDIAGLEAPLTRADGRLGGRVLTSDGALMTVQQSDTPVECLLLVDISGSMPDYKKELEALCAALAENSGENVSFTLATFGDFFQKHREGLSANEVLEEIVSVRYNAKNTRIYAGLGAALDDFSMRGETGGAFRQIVLLTDAVEDSGGEAGPSHEALLERLGQAPVLLHTVCFGDDAASTAQLGELTSASGGIHSAVDEMSPEEAAAAIMDAVGALTVARFSLAGISEDARGDSEPLSITFASGAEPVCKAEAALWFRLPEPDEAPAPGEETAPPSESPETGAPPATDAPLTENPPSGGTAATDAPSPQGKAAFPVIPVLVGAAALIAVAVVVIVLRRRPKAMPTDAPAADGLPGIYMRLEVLSGELRSRATEFNLTEGLIIGSGREADIRFGGAGLNECSARVFEANGTIYIEDLASPGGTFVNGLRIGQPNILRSGDEIKTGDAAFRLRF